MRHDIAKRGIYLILAVLSCFWFLYEAFIPAWSKATGDFPNYYTAARLMLRRAPLTRLYDYPSFQREIAHAKVDRQLGGYIPQTPLTMAPLLPLSSQNPQTAKRVWLLLNLGFLAASLALLSRMTRFSVAQAWLVVFLAYGSLKQNLVLGQYYVLLLAILTFGCYAILRRRERTAGFALASAFVLKLYGAPLLFFLAAKRRWRAVAAFAATAIVSIALAVGIFGWDGLAFYVTQILPRSLAGETLNPFHPSNGTFVTFLRRMFVAEPELNPHPLADFPAVFAFLQTAFTLGILLLPLLAAMRRDAISRRDLAWWMIALVAVSPNTASYTFVLLILPAVLLLDDLPQRDWLWLLPAYLLLALPLRASWSFLFPKAWLLLFLFMKIGWSSLPTIPWRAATAAAAAAGLAAAFVTTRFPEKSSRLAAPIAIQPAAIYSSAPIVARSGVFYESIANERYVIQRWDGRAFETYSTPGYAFHPAAPDSGERVYFESLNGAASSLAFFDVRNRHCETLQTDRPNPHDPAVSHDGAMLAFISEDALFLFEEGRVRRLGTPAPARSPSFAPGDRSLVYAAGARILRVDVATSETATLVNREAHLDRPSISPDGRLLAFASRQTGPWQVWIKQLPDGPETQITNGRCNSFAPAWTLDSREIFFASDCGRGLNLPALQKIADFGLKPLDAKSPLPFASSRLREPR